jgi:hypothetical protein
MVSNNSDLNPSFSAGCSRRRTMMPEPSLAALQTQLRCRLPAQRGEADSGVEHWAFGPEEP